jgi:predicted ATP-binding protein involved in virulence
MNTLFPHDLTPHPECHVASIQLYNYKAAADLRLELGKRLHVFVGDNGAGKTTLLDGIASGLARVALKAGIKHCGAERVELRTELIRRRNGQYAASSAVALRLGAGWCVNQEEVHGRTLPVFSTDAFEPPPLAEGQAIKWFNTHWAAAKDDSGEYLPVFAYYTADRAAFPAAPAIKGEGAPKRWDALRGAFGASTSYSHLVTWFSVMERAELYEMRRQGDTNYRDPVVEAVREAVRSIVPTVTGLSFDPLTGHLQAETEGSGGKNRFTLEELSGGRRVMVAMAADLARRMIQANPHLGLNSPAVVLIDEIDLHLHPKWQSTVIGDLMRTFPQAQFILTTHSEQVIGAVPSELVRAVRVEEGGVRAYTIGAVEGARFERILEDGMGLDGGRNKAHQDLLDRYWKLVDAGAGETEDGRALRAQLDELFQGKEPELARADVVMRRLRARKGDQ